MDRALASCAVAPPNARQPLRGRPGAVVPPVAASSSKSARDFESVACPLCDNSSLIAFKSKTKYDHSDYAQYVTNL